MTHLLTRLGCEIHDFEFYGVDGLKKLQEKPYSLVLMDCQMPIMSGYEATAKIRELPPPICDLKIIAMTANAMKGDREQCLKMGMDDYLSKPINEESLQRILTLYLKGPGLLPAISGKRILVVDDNETNRLIMKTILKEYAFEYDEAENGAIGVSKAKHQIYDLVIMDCHMPVLDGYEATKQIRGDERNKTTPILAVTANVVDGNRERCLSLGMNGFISKPFSEGEFIEAVLNLLDGDKQILKTNQALPNDEFQPLKLEEMFPGNTVVQLQIISNFVTELDSVLSALKCSIPENVTEDEIRKVHSLKGLCQTVDLPELEPFFQQLESQLKNEQYEESVATLNSCLSLWSDKKVGYDHFIATSQAP